MNKVVCIIPVRYGSIRFPGKPLVMIAGKSMLRRVYEQVKKAKSIDEVFVATDDERIKKEAEAFGAAVIITSVTHTCGTDRIAEAIQQVEGDIVLNVQGDEPLIDPQALESIVQPFLADSGLEMATLITRMRDKSEFPDANVVKVVKDNHNFALYFSRAAIPFSREGNSTSTYKQIGVYAYRRDFLLAFSKMEPTAYEKVEKLEQLRALENGHKIKLVETVYNPIGVDVPDDVAKVEAILKKAGTPEK